MPEHVAHLVRGFQQEYGLVAIASVFPHPQNPNRGNVNAIRASIREFGFVETLVVQRSSRRILGGEHTWRAAQAEGWLQIPVLFISIDDERALGLMLALNATRDRSRYDEDAREELLREAGAGATDDMLFAMGTTRDEVQMARGELFDEDEIEVPANPVTRPGDLIKLGPHRLICGDSRDASLWERLLEGRKADMLFTDPPYNVGYLGHRSSREAIANDKQSPEAFAEFLQVVFGNVAARLRPGAAVYVCGPTGPEMMPFLVAMQERRWWYQTLIWVKDTFVLGRKDYHWRHEGIFAGFAPQEDGTPWPDFDEEQHRALFYGSHPGAKRTWHGGRKEDTVWEYSRPRTSDQHSTMKPPDLVARAIRNSSDRGDLVVDAFLGSGSTLIACETLGRVAAGIELDPGHCDQIALRWERLTGQEVER